MAEGRDHLATILRHLQGNELFSETKPLLLEEIDRMWMILALGSDKDDRQKRIWKLMREEGLLSILGNDRDLLQRYVALITYAAISPKKEFIAGMFENDHADLSKTLAELKGCQAASGFPLYFETDG